MLAGLKKNIRDAQYLIDLYMAWKSDPASDPLYPRPFAQIDLRGCKAYAKVHYRNLVRAIKV